MKNKAKKNIFIIFIYYIMFLVKISDCSNNDHEGKCVYLLTETGSEIVNFHKYKNGKHIFINETEEEKWSINICNDTTYPKNNPLKFDSQIVYSNNEINYIFTGPFFRYRNDTQKIRLTKNNNQYIYYSQEGGYCNQDKSQNYSTSIIFDNKDVKNEEYAEIYELPKIEECTTNLKVFVNIEYSKDYLILQKVMNDCFIFTGIIFIAIGFYLCFMSHKYIEVTKVIISLITGEIIVFLFEITFIGNSSFLKGNIYILFIILGMLVGNGLGYLCLKKIKLLIFILSFSTGFITGIIFFDIFFLRTNCELTMEIFVNTIFIFSITFLVLMKIVPKYIIYYPPVIGSYILTRGLSIMLYNIFGKMGYRDLQLLLYLSKRSENDLVEKYFDDEFKFFWLYIILNVAILILSELLNCFLFRNYDKIYKEYQNYIYNNDNKYTDNTTELDNNAPLNINDKDTENESEN